ncbi:hypothetical protein OU994_03435 [Pseudoduganella sp. SL102]|uniref:hypothetical protein n=1 Tax=Pseudoduganella sp. SL102 TaxID=2995154 RepID=UPI00248BF752|nr:hypothetical protein [Pseudoduganella sp. SL102]WBS03374.1 hypothetical protein OU994_03435 [Pseudoduganella sp. SL102]
MKTAPERCRFFLTVSHDIASGLYPVAELFEAGSPKDAGMLAERCTVSFGTACVA